MNCYVCSVKGLDDRCPAVAICQQCGAGMCHEHLYTLGGATPVGMAGSLSRRHVCSTCKDLLVMRHRRFPASANAQAQTSPLQRWWDRWRARKEVLPEPHEAVAAAERILQTKRQ
jgi:hypothetical protein